MGKITFRVVIGILVVLLLYYVGRPLYWKISATVHDIRHNKQTVSGGFSQIVLAAQNSVGWFHDESDSGVRDGGIAAARRILLRKVIAFVILVQNIFGHKKYS